MSAPAGMLVGGLPGVRAATAGREGLAVGPLSTGMFTGEFSLSLSSALVFPLFYYSHQPHTPMLCFQR